MSKNGILILLLKLAGKGDMELDSAIPVGYIASTCWNYGTALVRGTLRGGGFESRNGRCFIDRDATIRCKNIFRLSSNVCLRDGVYIDALSRDGVTLGDRALLVHNNRRIECTGSFSAISKGMSIGHDSTFGAEWFFGAAGGIETRNDVIAGQLVRFHSENHNFAKKDVLTREQGVTHRGIKIGDKVWIGAGAVFLDGANVGGVCRRCDRRCHGGRLTTQLGHCRNTREGHQAALICSVAASATERLAV
jgi:acetyltransferase-like isoleucine patch superfamily enzyme